MCSSRDTSYLSRFKIVPRTTKLESMISTRGMNTLILYVVSSIILEEVAYSNVVETKMEFRPACVLYISLNVR